MTSAGRPAGLARRVLTNPTLLGIVLDYSAWKEITDDIDDARVYGGIHFRFDREAGSHQGRHVGKYILRNYLRSADELDADDGDDDNGRCCIAGRPALASLA